MTTLYLLLGAGALTASMITSAHAILYKRDVRSAIGWAGFIWITPYLGALIYWLFGVNRIRRRAAILRPLAKRRRRRAERHSTPSGAFGRVGDSILGTCMSSGNDIAIHATGERAFAAMFEAIEQAERSVALAIYIFERDDTGKKTIALLRAAAARGLAVRVLIDAVGSTTSGQDVVEDLNRGGVEAALFLPPRIPGMRSLNLRNHRKLLLLDGTHAFTGGMNIADGYARPSAVEPIRDTQFHIRGPVVRDFAETFAMDWQFTTGESLHGDLWFPRLATEGEVTARVLADGPDESFELCRWVILGALATARRHVRIVTPYFVPDNALITALNVAALRGVTVDIFIPERLDHAFVKWASNAQLWQVLEKGCRVWFTPPPFDHSKIFTIDGQWSFFGSSNWDTRSMRLNFELNVEVSDEAFTRALDSLIDDRCRSARPITLEIMDARSIPVRLRDGIARLFSPYL